MIICKPVTLSSIYDLLLMGLVTGDEMGCGMEGLKAESPNVSFQLPVSCNWKPVTHARGTSNKN